MRSTDMLVTVDKEDFVVSVKHEPSDAMMDSAVRDIERSDMLKLETRICKGPWHYKQGKGTLLPIDQFPFNRYKNGQRTATCGECLEKSGKRNKVAENPTVRKLENAAREPLTLNEINHGMSSAVHKWKVLVLQPTEVIVYAYTYSEIPAEVSGEVLRVERLD